MTISEGPQKWRGQINSMQSFLTLLDSDFRNSLLDQALYHKNNGELGFYFELHNKSYFFKNVHMNLGNMKW